ncbi:hypothetical protein [Gordonia hankookensis]|uniref:Transcriptional regulator, AbiEi antitoxin, Type IV TA system n=1 Tax=Gordonia hankookensis TaxID=589403 RepID=A0ABR7W9X4_9ACTN|nr:hypothetical protein [Gordonia hankookensis]MBD1319616.1 hypothetical protein [Gordonia hankookensis]
MTPFPTDRHGLIHRAAVLSAHFSADEYRRALHTKETISVGRGVCVPAGQRSPTEWHRLKAVAASVTSDVAATLSHQSAAAIHGVEMLRPNLRRIHMTTGSPDGGYRTTTQHRHVGTFGPDEVVEIEGLRVTSLERTAVDVACSSPMGFAGALAVFDSALRKGADREVMAGLLGSRRRGAAHARRALHHADGLSENPGESWGRAQMIEAGLPVPRLQHEFRGTGANVIARTDYDWAGLLVGEFDGRVKYEKLVRPGESTSDVVIREKAREDALRRLGIVVVRWTWSDLENGRVVGVIREWLTRLAIIAA